MPPLIPPRALPDHPHLAVLAISSPSELPRIEKARRALESRGVRITLAENIDHRYGGYLAGTDEERLEILNRFLRSPEFDAFFFARGGYGAMRILEGIDYQAIAANPRPIVGFSDLTALHQAVAVRTGIGTFHGPMLNLDFYEGMSSENEAWLWSILRGEAPLIHRFEPSQVISEGEASGVLFGGCLSLTASLAGTPFDYWVGDGIWFWEEVGEATYRIDRMLTHLRLSGRMRDIRGVVIGKLKECGGAEGETHSLLREFFGSSGIPVVRDLPFGHYGDNVVMPVGAPARLSTREGTLTVTEPAARR